MPLINIFEFVVLKILHNLVFVPKFLFAITSPCLIVGEESNCTFWEKNLKFIYLFLESDLKVTTHFKKS